MTGNTGGGQTPHAQPVHHIPIAIAFPVYAGIHNHPAPQQYKFGGGNSMGGLNDDIWSILSSMDVYTVRQHLKLLPKKCCACPPCAPQEATFSVYAGPSAESQMEILRLDEVSDDWNRCCCRPFHSFKLEARQYVPMPGHNLVSDYSFLSAQVQSDWSRLQNDRVSQQGYERDFYKSQPVLFSIQRTGGQRCIACPCKLLSTFVWCQCCADGVEVFAGPIAGHPQNPEKERGMPYERPLERMIGSVTQPVFGGCCIPFLLLSDFPATPTGENQPAPFGKAAGPCFFAGWSEMCCSFRFNVSNLSSDRHSGDIGAITKRRPASASQAAVTLCCNGDADVYSVAFAPGISAQRKVTTFAAQILLDYMLFDGQTEKCKWENDVIYCYLCYCLVCGQLCPFQICIPTKFN